MNKLGSNNSTTIGSKIRDNIWGQLGLMLALMFFPNQ